MKVIRVNADEVVFRLGKREKNLLLQLLNLYPRVPPAHLKVTRTTELEPESQHLLDEALADQRKQNKEQVQRLVSDASRFRHDEKGLLLSLSHSELEWLLQVINDIRVGSWISLGSPEDISPMAEFDPQKAPDMWVMDLCGYFQAALLDACRDSGLEHA